MSMPSILGILATTAICLAAVGLSLCCRQTKVTDYSHFHHVYSYEELPSGDARYFKLIKWLSFQHRLSLKVPYYVYLKDGNYYVFHRYPVTDEAEERKTCHYSGVRGRAYHEKVVNNHVIQNPIQKPV